MPMVEVMVTARSLHSFDRLALADCSSIAAPGLVVVRERMRLRLNGQGWTFRESRLIDRRYFRRSTPLESCLPSPSTPHLFVKHSMR